MGQEEELQTQRRQQEESRQRQQREEDARRRQQEDELRAKRQQEEEELRKQRTADLSQPSSSSTSKIQFQAVDDGDSVGFGVSSAAMGLAGRGAPGPFGIPSQQMAHMMLGPRSQLQLVLPLSIVKGKLVPRGQLGEVASGCNVQIDLGEEVAPGGLRVVLTGTCV